MDTNTHSTPDPPAGSGGTAPPRRGASSPAGSEWRIVVVAAAGIIVGAAGVVALRSRTPETMATAAAAGAAGAANAASAPAAAARAPEPATSSAPKWVGGVQMRGRNAGAVYQLDAENEISVWMKRIRPALVIRCSPGSTEAFVLTQSAAAIERSDGMHSVALSFDGQPDRTERWLASEDYDALFAPDALTFARRVAASRSLRFGFTPYNASPAVAVFDLRGFDALLRQIGTACRWR